MTIFWFRPTKGGLLYILPTITYTMVDQFILGTDHKVGEGPIINFVWLYWSIVVFL